MRPDIVFGMDRGTSGHVHRPLFGHVIGPNIMLQIGFSEAVNLAWEAANIS